MIGSHIIFKNKVKQNKALMKIIKFCQKFKDRNRLSSKNIKYSNSFIGFINARTFKILHESNNNSKNNHCLLEYARCFKQFTKELEKIFNFVINNNKYGIKLWIIRKIQQNMKRYINPRNLWMSMGISSRDSYFKLTTSKLLHFNCKHLYSHYS